MTHARTTTTYVTRHKSRQRKSPNLYYGILALWAVLFGLAIYDTWSVTTAAFNQNASVGTLVLISLGFIGYFWLNGIKDVVYTLFYHLWEKGRVNLPRAFKWPTPPHVVMIYCTYNDFNGESLYESMQQDYTNFRVVILDDSTKQEYRDEIDTFAAQHGLQVVRRPNNIGFKAGNINNFLMPAAEAGRFDYFVILDSDEVVPTHFIQRALDYFAANPQVGIVQANHMATRNRNDFMKRFAPGVDSHWPVYQQVKDRYGFMSLLGHGAMVSRECYLTAHGFPHVVAEDICFALAARRAGYLTVFASDILCEEEFPVDYMAFVKRHNKWTQGNMEFILKNTWPILSRNSGLRWFEKLDIVLFTYSLPLTAVFSFYVIINVFGFPLANHVLRYPMWMLAPTVVFLLAPMLNDIIWHWRTMGKRELASYLMHSTLLFGSMFFVSLVASVKSLFGGSVFLVTPKDAARVSFGEAIHFNRSRLLFATGVVLATVLVNDSILPVLLLVLPALASPYLTVMHNQNPKAPKLPRQATAPPQERHEHTEATPERELVGVR